MFVDSTKLQVDRTLCYIKGALFIVLIQRRSETIRNIGSNSETKKPHAVCIPYPAQGHVTPMLKVAKLLHLKDFHVTFVNTEYNHKRLLKARGHNSLDGLEDFRFEFIPDGLPPSDADVTQDIPAVTDSTQKTCLAPFRELLAKLNSSNVIPSVTCIVADAGMFFALDVAEELGVPIVSFWTTSACVFLAYAHYKHLIDKGLAPLKDMSYLTNGYLETKLDWIPAMKNVRLREFPSFILTTDPNDMMVNFVIEAVDKTQKASAVIVNTFDDLEQDVLDALSSMFPPIYSIGPLNLLLDQTPQNDGLASIGSNLWKEESECLWWLDSKETNSVVFVNFGSVTVMAPQQLVEFAWGLANSLKPFLWIIRPDLVKGDTAILPPEFLEETKGRSLIARWCPQEQVLKHPSVGGFLSHMGWNSTIESLSNGLPMLCWPFFADQPTNCRFACIEWGFGKEIKNNANRDEVEKLVRELMDGEKGKEMKSNAMEWKSKAEVAAGPSGSSFMKWDKLIKDVLLSQKP